MATKERIDKAIWSIRHEGVGVFSKKLIRFIPWAIGRTHVKYSHYLPAFLRADGGRYDSEFMYLSNPIFNITSHDLTASREITDKSGALDIKSATWFVPYFNHLSFGGIYTIFRFIDYFASQGVKNRIVIYDRPTVDGAEMKEQIVKVFPGLADSELIIFNAKRDDIKDLPATDIAVCTFWVSAYLLLRFNQTKRKYYFIQDYEPLFYEGGSTSALAESTYRFGFSGIVNTPGLLRAVNQRHGLEGVSFTPAVDPRFYFPPEPNERKSKPIRVFFYARPNNPRNAFHLGVQIIELLIEKYGDAIEIITAGAEWKEKKYGLKDEITNLGLLHGLDQVGALYRSCDIGFVYMLSKHPSYQPFEFMASGVATVTNNNEDNLWFLQDETNCLIAEPSPAAMAEKIGWLIEDKKLRQKVQEGGYKTVSTDWNPQAELIWNEISKGKH